MQPTSDKHRERLLETIRRSIIGDDEAFEGPYGVRKITYADYTASGRSLSIIEDYIRDEVLPRYANTHTEISGTGRQTSLFREQAREIVREAIDVGDEEAVIFCGTGATGAINKLVGIMNLRIPNDLDRRYGFREQIDEEDRLVVFVGPFEHHSNELPWKESLAEVVHIDLNEDGGICIDHLETQLKRFEDRPLKIGSFSAASNVTGITSDIDGISNLLHEHDALAFWDYAAAGPYIDVKMNSETSCRDAIFISPHKFIGGPGCPGVLIVKRGLCANRVPVEPGGGTVTWVREADHDYIDDIETREEGGTPDIIGSIRTGLVFQLKEAVGVDYIRAREDDFVRRCIARWRRHPNIEILGNHEHDRISIVSFLLRHGERYLHWSYVVALLNDVFGIQARGGCSCAGPYGHLLLGIDRDTSQAFEALIHRGLESAKPGWVRLNFNYFITDAVFEFLLSAVEFVADNGWKLLPQYEVDVEANVWRHRAGYPAPPMSLHDVCYAHGRIEYQERHIRKPESVVASYLDEARELVAGLPGALAGTMIEDPELDPEFERLRWFLLPGEALAELRALDEAGD